MEALEIWYWTNLNFLVTGSCQRVFCSLLQAQACQKLTDNLVHYFAVQILFLGLCIDFFYSHVNGFFKPVSDFLHLLHTSQTCQVNKVFLLKYSCSYITDFSATLVVNDIL